MMKRSLIALAALAIVASPATVLAQSAQNSTVTINGNVAQACMMGTPVAETLDIGDLTGTDGRITPVLAGTAVAVSTTIPDSWCNVPSTLSVDGEPMTLQNGPSWAVPAGFTRMVTYDATLQGWPNQVTVRPVQGDTAQTTAAASAHADTLTLNISRLEALNAAGTSAEPLNVLETGSYQGSVTISIAPGS